MPAGQPQKRSQNTLGLGEMPNKMPKNIPGSSSPQNAIVSDDNDLSDEEWQPSIHFDSLKLRIEAELDSDSAESDEQELAWDDLGDKAFGERLAQLAKAHGDDEKDWDWMPLPQ
jgi:hypothetical protein